MDGQEFPWMLTPSGAEGERVRGPVPDSLLRWVADAGRALWSAEDYEATLKAVAGFAVPTFADLAVLLLVDHHETPRLEVAHRDPSLEPEVTQMVRARADALRRAAERLEQTARGGKPQWLARVTDAAVRKLTSGDNTLANLRGELALHSLLIYPLRAHGRVLGVLALARTSPERPYSAADSAAGLLLARRAALAIEDARLRQETAGIWARRHRLSDALSKWAHVFEHASWGAAILDSEDWRVEAANTAFAQMHGFEQREDMIGRAFADFVAPDRRAEVIERLQQQPDEPHSYEVSHLRTDGSTFPALVNVTVVKSPEGGVLYRAADVQDLTEIKRAESRLHRAQHMEAVGRLAGGVAHEVNNMMTIVLGFSDYLLGAADMSRQRREDVREIRKAAVRAAGITRQLLAFSRQQLLQPTVLDLNAVAADTAQLLRPLLPADVRLDTRLARTAVSVRADRAQLEQVLINLAFNARDAMPRGGSLTLATECRLLTEEDGRRCVGVPISPGPYGLLRVIDTGHGMDAQTQARIFEPFFTTKGAGEGTGLGLATVYGIVKQSDGYIWVESTVGQGTTFTICLPEVGSAATPVHVRRKGITRARATETVLVVEDEDALRDLTARLLRSAGYRVLEARDGLEALATAQQADPIDLVLTDVVMPEMGGRELRDRLATVRPEVPVLYMSAYTSDDIVQRGLVATGDAFIQKPFTPQTLTERVREALAPTERRR